MFRGKKSMRRKVKIKTKNEKIIDRYGTKHTEKVITIREKQCNVSSHMNYL